MKRYLFARTLRAAGRLLLFIGAMLALGLTALNIYFLFYKIAHPGFVLKPLQFSFINTLTIDEMAGFNQFAAYITAVTSILLAIALIILVAKVYNEHARNAIARIARLFRVQIFTVEVMGTIIAWTITVLLFAFFVPAAAIIATFMFIVNELLFIFAWGAYGQPNYKI